MIANKLDTDCGVSASELVRFAAGDSERPERRRILEHLLAGCGRCRETLSALREIQNPIPMNDDGADTGPSIARILTSLGDRAAKIEKERAESAHLLPEFLAHPVARQWTLLRNTRRYDT